jgi:hypothetical protein
LLDGFGELARRVTCAGAEQHFERIVAAAQRRTKIVVTNRREHFLSDRGTRMVLAERMAGRSSWCLSGCLRRPLSGLGYAVFSRDRSLPDRFLRPDALPARVAGLVACGFAADWPVARCRPAGAR